MSELKQYTLGSGHLHIEKYTNDTLPADWNAFFASQDNLLGRIKGGAEIEYSTEKFEDEDDLGYIKIEEVTSENVVLRSGVMTWDADTLAKLCQTARSTTSADGMVTTKIGGLANSNNEVWVLGFEYKNRNLRVIIVGKNNEGFTFGFRQDETTLIDCEFTAQASDDEGTLIMIQDLRKCPTVSSLAIGNLTLTPSFSPFITTYTAATSNAKDSITATPKDSTCTVEIKNGDAAVSSGSDATWSEGDNVVTVTSTDADGKVMTYTVNVTYTAAT